MGVFITAEIGINHNGSLNTAKEMIRAAVDAGCDAVKFQKRTIDIVYASDFLASARQSPWGTTQRAQKEGLEFHLEEYQEIDNYCQSLGIDWYASAWDTESQRFLQQFDLRYNKVASAMLTNYPLLQMIADEGKKTYISTGMSHWEEIDAAVEVFNKANCPFELMHCNSTYPMEETQANLRMIDQLRNRYHCDVGYSGHECNNLVCVCAVSRGATSIERHLTLDRTMYGSDQKASIEPDEFKELVELIRRTEAILGNGERKMSDEEYRVRKKLRG